MTTGSPWFRARHEPGQEPIRGDERVPENGYAAGDGYVPESGYAPGGGYVPEGGYAPEAEPHGRPGAQGQADPYASPEAYAPAADPYARAEQYTAPADPYGNPGAYAPSDSHAPAADPYVPDNSYAQPRSYPQERASARGDTSSEGPYEPPYGPYGAEEGTVVPPGETAVLPVVEGPSEPSKPSGATDGPPPGPGRAERRRAAKGGRGKGRRPTNPPAAVKPAAPLSRVEARRAAREAKESVGVVASRIVGELFITLGVVMLLFVTYQLWWTNVLAGQETSQAKERIEDTWAKGGGEDQPGAFEPGEGFAIMYIPKLDVVVPIAEGIDKTKVLDKGMVGHYAEGGLKTAMPSDKQGNFAVAGHRNTHGEPFRYINRLKPGDPIVVETRNAYYTYEMASILPQTPPSNVSVIQPVPKGSGFTEPGRYITLTTCTPEFTSTYRMIVWGRLLEERPRSKGKPEALVG
ncbi:class E sortase [Streptomyces sp. bgisy095]|uniref:class E sortase n=1 Tax=unclassified Streptomyces TaxID=2593676 RepID=UPI003D737AE6